MRLLKCKKWLCVLAGLVVLLVGSVSVFAKTHSQLYSEGRAFAIQKLNMSSSEFDKKYPYVFCNASKNGNFYIVFANHGDSVYYNTANPKKDGLGTMDGNSSFPAYSVCNIGGTWGSTNGSAGYGDWWYYCVDDEGAHYSNFDIKTNKRELFCSSDTTGFFQAPPIAERAGDLPKVVAEMVKVILPVAVSCLALWIFSTVLLKRLPIFLH